MTDNSPKEMRVVQVAKAGGPLELVMRPIPEPGPGKVRVRVEACGVCHSDTAAVEGNRMPVKYPTVPGHEVIGLVDGLGDGVVQWKVGDRVGLGWFGGNCGRCEACRRGDLICCVRATPPGIGYDGGYADYLVAPATALASVPEELDSVEAAPLMCAGITTFNALRNSGARAGDTVAILGIGGLGHLGVQFAAKMGFRTVAIARGADKEAFVRQLGAHHYIDSTTQKVAAALQKLGGARTILATVTDAEAMGAAIGGLGLHGNFVIVGLPSAPLSVTVLPMIGKKQRIQGWPSGTAIDSEDTLKFSQLTGVKAMIERYPLEKAAEAYERMMSGKARFRVVLEMAPGGVENRGAD
jgi:D-arabinose 1-dehydrogenase-like Zn-dependent alcohol dehydrogenase